mmetsp:Transcript_46520/g.81919  ORF Transcript_46520/g.81919 Transcript_46520/m.81919 type:complete len:217 (-) Transcript_46520:198-848(-)
MPGAIGAIAARRKRREKIEAGGHLHTPDTPGEIGKERRRETKEAKKKTKALQAVMAKYDTNKSGKLEADQVRQLLTDTDGTTPKGQPPTEDELDFVLKVADQSGDGSLSFSELEFALKSWNVYLRQKDKMGDAFDTYDKSRNGELSQEEMKAYLTDLNNKYPVSDEEVEWVMQEADVFGDGKIRKVEMVMATSAWYALADAKEVRDQKSSSFCGIQ